MTGDDVTGITWGTVWRATAALNGRVGQCCEDWRAQEERVFYLLKHSRAMRTAVIAHQRGELSDERFTTAVQAVNAILSGALVSRT